MLSWPDTESNICYRRLLECIREGTNDEAQSLLAKVKTFHVLPVNFEFSLLHYSVIHHNVEMLQHLIKEGYNVNAQNEYSITPLMLAVKIKASEVVKVLLNSNANVYITDCGGISLLQYVFQHCILCLSRENLKQNQEFMILKILFEKVSSDFLRDKNTVIQLFLNANNTVKLAVVAFGYIKLAEIMLKNNYPINFYEPILGHTALHWAIIMGKLENAKMLIKNAANIMALNKIDPSPIRYYVWDFERVDEKSDVLQSLLKHSINSGSLSTDRVEDVEQLFKYGKKKTVVTVLQTGIDVMAINFSQPFLHLLIANKNDDVLDVLHEFDIKYDVNEFTSNGDTALLTAARTGSLKKVEFLLNHGADVTLKGSDGFTALYNVLFDFNPKNTEEDADAAKITEILLQNGADAQFIYENTFFLYYLSNSAARLSTNVIIAHLALHDMICNASQSTKAIRFQTDIYPPLQVYFDLCTQQLEEMKNIQVQSTVTLFKLMTEDEQKCVVYARNKNFILAFDEKIKSMPQLELYYLNTLQKRFANAISKIKLHEKAASKLDEITGICSDVFHAIVYKIISNLSHQDLQNLCKVQDTHSINIFDSIDSNFCV